jgi:4-alpha-glucanotransferase
VVTPRMGKPVEINALWYNALRVMEEFAVRLGGLSGEFQALANRVESGFKRFIRPGGGLYDVLDGPDGDDGRVRPNQIFAVSLPHSPLNPSAQRHVVDECGRHLLCSFGLRSLSPSADGYKGRYGGEVLERDGAYHQGTVWAWLLGHYALARYRVEGNPQAAQSVLEPLADHLSDAGLGTVSEIFDGAPPHIARGAPSQAWSVACTLQAWVRLERERRKMLLGSSVAATAQPDEATCRNILKSI